MHKSQVIMNHLKNESKDSTLSLILVLGTLGIRGWEGSRTGPDMGGKSHTHWDLIPGTSSL